MAQFLGSASAVRNVHVIVGVDADRVGIEGLVMDLGKRQSVRYNGLSQLFVCVGKNVCGVKQPLLR